MPPRLSIENNKNMAPFNGFTPDENTITVPVSLFTDLLPEISHPAELKVTLYALWFFQQHNNRNGCLRLQDMQADSRFFDGMGATAQEAQCNILEGLERAVIRSTLLRVLPAEQPEIEAYFFLNSPRGRTAILALQRGEWTPSFAVVEIPRLDMERPNIFTLYEKNIGPLTPMIAETLTEAEQTYPRDWIEDAIRVSVENNKRSWRYVEAILRSRLEKGNHEKDRSSDTESGRKYIGGKFSDFIKH
jgi:DnaD/phage-associated family protein